MKETSRTSGRGQATDVGVFVADTIFALATAATAAAIAVIRLSGPAADEALSSMIRDALPALRRASVRRLYGADGSVLDEAVVLRFPEGSSYTGEAMTELHCHGGRAVVAAVLERLSALPGLRQAEPGEFTRRAFENGRMDLAEIEGLGDLVAAETEYQRRQAMRVYEGGLSQRIEAWRKELITALALTEVTIDWADEEVPEDTSADVAALIRSVVSRIGETIRLSDGAEKLRHGFEVALVGAPNSGKSSLVNYLAGREAAITSAVPGTTRDVIELRYDLMGLPVIWLDMAGLRDKPSDEVEAIGVERARSRAAAADLRVFLDAPDAPLGALADGLRAEDDISTETKADLTGNGLSALTGEGVSALLDQVAAVLKTRVGDGGVVSRDRQQRALEAAMEPLMVQVESPEIQAEYLRQAIRRLDRVLGRVDPESVLDQIFSRFCLGK